MKKILIAAAFGLIALPAFAQGGSPYNSSGQNAGGPRAGMERRMGAPGGLPSGYGAAPRSERMMRSHRMSRHHYRHVRRHHGY